MQKSEVKPVSPGAFRAVVIGRDPGCDLVLDDPMVSARHARVIFDANGAQLEDLRSTNGTFLRGQRVSSRMPLQVGDTFGLGTSQVALQSPGHLVPRSYHGQVTIEARRLSLDVPGGRLVEDISFTILPSEVVGLMGPSGAGKTTLMTMLNGYQPPSEGQVLFNGLDIYDHFEQFRLGIGYVPQDDIIHGELTPREALRFTARLRLPPDTRAEEIESRIDQILGQLGLTEVADRMIGHAARKVLSGGQRKRVNVALELLTRPWVLFLDEPTSGLSSEDALSLIRLLRNLADQGTTILLTIHQPSLDVFRVMDHLALLGKEKGSREPARLVYFGPAFPDSLCFFQPEVAGEVAALQQHKAQISPEIVFEGLKRRSVAEWVGQYRQSSQFRRFILDRSGRSTEPVESAPQRAPRSSFFRQTCHLAARALLLKLKDRGTAAILLLQAPIIGVLIVQVFGDQALQVVDSSTWPIVGQALTTSLFLMAITALWFGCSNAAREIVGEMTIFRRERMVNLSIPAYITSKLLVLGLISAVQCAVLLAIVDSGCELNASSADLFWILLGAAWVGTAAGLLVSALAKTSETAVSLIPLVLLPMVIFGGILQPLDEMQTLARSVAGVMPSRWAFEGLLTLESDARPTHAAVPVSNKTALPPQFPKPPDVDIAERYFPREVRRSQAAIRGVLVMMLAALLAAIGAVLRSRDLHS